MTKVKAVEYHVLVEIKPVIRYESGQAKMCCPRSVGSSDLTRGEAIALLRGLAEELAELREDEIE